MLTRFGRPLRNMQLVGAGTFLGLAMAAIGLVWISIWLVGVAGIWLDDGPAAGAMPSMAPAIVGGAFLAPLLFFMLVTWLRPKPQDAPSPVRWLSRGDDDLAEVTRAAEALVEKWPLLALALAALAGTLAVRFPAALTVLISVIGAKGVKGRSEK